SSDAGRYVVEVSNECGTVTSSDVDVVLSSVEEEALAAGYRLTVQPQPVGDVGIVSIGGPVGSSVEGVLYDGSGRRVMVVWRGVVGGSGMHQVQFGATELASGVYRCVLESGRYRLSVPLTIVR
ncbi:MAG: hypothetical protein N3B17_02770, partial [Chlorobi bacterium]|nr:hypothetical protein [Chlorobiota bacterium]